jgi:spore germination protein GerM
MKRYLLYAGLILLLGGIVSLFFMNKQGFWVSDGNVPRSIPSELPKASEKTSVQLYFANREKAFLSAENREFFHAKDPERFGRDIMNALIKGPQQSDFISTIPKDTALRAFYIAEDGTAYADFTEAVSANHPGGSESELMTIYSIVNSLILNIPEISSVKILVEGKESVTLAGHIDLRFPFKANMLLVR